MRLVDVVLELIRRRLPRIVAHNAVLDSLLHRISHHYKAMIGRLVHLGVFERLVARQASSILSIEPRNVVPLAVCGNGLYFETVAIGVYRRLVVLGIRRFLLLVGVNIGQLIDIVNQAPLVAVPDLAADFSVDEIQILRSATRLCRLARRLLRRAGRQRRKRTNGTCGGQKNGLLFPYHILSFLLLVSSRSVRLPEAQGVAVAAGERAIAHCREKETPQPSSKHPIHDPRPTTQSILP